MKKLITLIAFAAISLSASAQRFAYLEATVLTPISGDTIHSGVGFPIDVAIKNLGPDSLQTKDSTWCYFTLDGQVQGVAFYRTNHKLIVGDSIHITTSLVSNFPSTSNGTHQFCIIIQPQSPAADSVSDTVFTNNGACLNVVFAGGTTGVQQLMFTKDAKAAVSVYPNPATTEAKFNINLPATSEVSVNILDITGRVVLTQNAGKMNAGSNTLSINTAGLANGMYIYQVSTVNGSTSGKFSVVK